MALDAHLLRELSIAVAQGIHSKDICACAPLALAHHTHLSMQVLLGMVWVWPETGPVAFIESAAAEPAVNQRVRDIDPGPEGWSF